MAWYNRFLPKASAFGVRSQQLGGSVTDASGLISQITGPAEGSNGGGVPGQGVPSQMGPGIPPAAFPLGGDPRLWQYRTGYNLPSAPGEGRVSYAVLREVANVEWLTRKAIEVRKNQIHNIKLDIVAKERKSMVRASKVMKDNEDRILEVKKFFVKPDSKNTFHNWLSAILEDHLVYDAIALEKRRNLNPDEGPKHPTEDFHLGKLISLELIDGTTIKPLLDDSGRTPLPPLPAYQQYLYGIPRWSASSQEMIYAVKNKRNFSPYGFSAVEQFLWMVNITLRYWAWVGAKYTDGTLPEGIGEAPPNWTTAQIAELNDYWDSLLAGDPRALRKLHFVPGGFKWHQFKESTFDEKFTRLLIEMTSVAFDVTPQEMGFSTSGRGTQIGGGKSQGESAEELAYRRGPQPLVTWLIDEILNPLLWEEFNGDDLEWSVLDENKASEQDHAKALDLSLKNGLVSLDQAIEENGGEPIGVGRLFALGQVLLGEKDLLKITNEGWPAFQKDLMNVAGAGQAGNPNGKPTEMMNGQPASALGHSMSGPSSPTNPAVEPEQITNNARRLIQHGGGVSSETSKDDKGDTHHNISLGKKNADLKNFEDKAIKNFKKGKSANVKFDSDEITSDQMKIIREGLTKAASVADIKESFTKTVRLTETMRVLEAVDREIEDRVGKSSQSIVNLYPQFTIEQPAAPNVDVTVQAPIVKNMIPKFEPTIVRNIMPKLEQPVVHVQAPSVTVVQPERIIEKIERIREIPVPSSETKSIVVKIEGLDEED